MEQTGNKGGMAALSGGLIGRKGSRDTWGGVKEGNGLTEDIETKSDAKLKNAFKSTFKTANIGVIAWLLLLSNAALCMALWKMTGMRWVSLIGAGSFLSAIGGIFTAFTAQTSNQFVRIDAKHKGKDRDFFAEVEKECTFSKTAAECYGFIRRAFSRGGDVTKHRRNRCGAKYARNRRTAGNARSCRRAPRTAFARPSRGGGDDDSGGSDQGDPPGPSHHASPLKLSHHFYRKLNSPHWRPCLSRVPRCWRVPCGERSGWGRAA
jgi:hypothetical protein